MDTFKVHVTFTGDGGSMVEEHTTHSINDALTRLTRGPAAMLGIIHEIKVVDVLDCTNFHYKDGQVLFP